MDLELLLGVGDAAARSAQGVGRPDHQGEAGFGLVRLRFRHGGHGAIGRHRLADVSEKLPEKVPVFRFADGFQRGAQQPNLITIQHAGVGQVHGQVQAGLPAQGGQDSVGPLRGDNAFQHRNGERFDVHPVGDIPVGHNGGRIGVDQHHRDALFAEGLARLGAGVVELGGLADDDGAGADDEDFAGLLERSGQRLSSWWSRFGVEVHWN